MIVMFHPYVPRIAKTLVTLALETRWIGQGPEVDRFERMFGKVMKTKHPVAVNSGTSALWLAYHLLGIKPGDEVIVPVLTCTATNIPLIHMGAKLIFADVGDMLNPDKDDILSKITPKTKAIVNVHLYGNLNKLGKMPVPVIGDMAQCHTHPIENYACYSFQAIKQMTTGDGGMLCVKTKDECQRAKKLRWFGIDREKKKNANWQSYKGREVTMDFSEVGWKFQMTDIAASLGIGALYEYENTMSHLKSLEQAYRLGLSNIDGLKIIGGTWSFPILVERREDFCKQLYKKEIETNVVQIRNDVVSAFGGKRQNLPNMNAIEDQYISLPLHMHMTIEDVEYICNTIQQGW